MRRSPTLAPRHARDDTQPYNRPRPPHAQPVRRTPTRRRPNQGRRLKLVALLLIAVIVVGIALLWQRAAAFNEAVSTEPATSMRLFGPFAEERVNVLLLGYSDESRDGAYLSDSMNLLSIDSATDTTSIIPIPRDLWVEGMPQVPQNMKINEALRIGYYADGMTNGADLAAEAVTYVTGLPVHGWVTIDFQGFQAMVDAVGGVTVENPRAFAYTWSDGDWAAGVYHGSFAAGTLELSGQQALDYARTRYSDIPEEHGDFARLQRQQRVMQAIRETISGSEALPRGLAALDALEGHLHTNIPVIDLAFLFSKLDVDHRVELDTVVSGTTNSIGQYVLAVTGAASASDYSVLHAYIDEQLRHPLPSPTPTGSGHTRHPTSHF